jgi:hypothetical protein
MGLVEDHRTYTEVQQAVAKLSACSLKVARWSRNLGPQLHRKAIVGCGIEKDVKAVGKPIGGLENRRVSV